ncbi:hypothetical protein [Caloranaerobacter sp. DY30410]|uniref:hypothetical protein n=1 Tax=Caloranaerobacter sp. DY30410 TaxID=3238305 RepID=UPI003D05D07A
MGGAHASQVAEKVIKEFDFIDFIVKFEGEIFAEQYSKFLQGEISFGEVPNVVYIEQGNIKHNRIVPLIRESELPMLPYDFEIIKYNKQNLINKTISIEGGRGCPFNCVFCSTKLFWQRKSRLKPVNMIIEEMNYLHKHLKVKAFKIVHDLFTLIITPLNLLDRENLHLYEIDNIQETYNINLKILNRVKRKISIVIKKGEEYE